VSMAGNHHGGLTHNYQIGSNVGCCAKVFQHRRHAGTAHFFIKGQGQV
jgi:hypothetical protein